MAAGKTERELLEEMNERLREIAGLLTIQGKTQDEQIDVLTGLGFDSETIGLLLAYPVKRFSSAEPSIINGNFGSCIGIQIAPLSLIG